MLLTLLCILLLLLDVQPDNGETNGDEADSTDQYDQVERSCGRNEKLKAPVQFVVRVREDDEL